MTTTTVSSFLVALILVASVALESSAFPVGVIRSRLVTPSPLHDRAHNGFIQRQLGRQQGASRHMAFSEWSEIRSLSEESFRDFVQTSVIPFLTDNLGVDQGSAVVSTLESESNTILYGTSIALASLLFQKLFAVLFPPARLISTMTLEQLVEGTYLETQQQRRQRPIECVYKASRDGWTAIDFHTAVDNRGSALVVAKTISGATFGGYNPTGWRSSDDYYRSSGAFLWALGSSGILPRLTPKSSPSVAKFPVLSGGDAAVFDYATSGPCFGNSDLVIGPAQAAVMGGFAGPDMEDTSLSAGNCRQGSAVVGLSYTPTSQPGGMNWPIRGKFRLADVEVYCAE